MNEALKLQKLNSYVLKSKKWKNCFDNWHFSFCGKNVETGEIKKFYIDYFILNPELNGGKVLFAKQNKQKSDLRSSYVMIKAGVFGERQVEINNFYSPGELILSKKNTELQIGSSRMTDNSISGSVSMNQMDADFHQEYMSGVGTIHWNLQVFKLQPFLLNEAKPFKKYFLKFSDYFSFISGIVCEYEGLIFLNDEKYEVIRETSCGYSDKMWGKSFGKFNAKFFCSSLRNETTGEKLQNSFFFFTEYSSVPHKFVQKPKNILQIQVANKTYFFDLLHKSSNSTLNIEQFNDSDAKNFHWTINAETKKLIADIYFECDEPLLSFVHFPSIATSTPMQILSTISGVGKIQIFQKVKERLELIEDLSFENGGCSVLNEN